ncbi:MAG: pitrilysin family protein [Coxiellaceae bacterium]|nr:pitrilysin family protein [Coxiellaceae bacterium]
MKLLKGLLLLCLPVLAFAKTDSKLLDIQQWKTNNGTAVYFVQAKTIPMIDLSVIFAAGSQYDNQQFGLANFTSSLLGEGTTTKSANQVADAFASTGGQFSAHTNRDMTEVSLRTLTEEKYFNTNVDTFLDVLTKPSFGEKAVGRVKKQLLTAIKLKQQSPSAVAATAFYKAVYGDAPYGHTVLGNRNTVQHIERKTIVSFYKQHYVAANAVITLVGDLSVDKAKTLAENISTRLALGKKTKPHTTAQAIKSAVSVKIPFNARQSTVILGQVGVLPYAKNKAALNVGNFILGNPGLVSQLALELRQKRGWVYGVSSQFKNLQLKGPFYIGLQTKASQTQPALKLSRQLLAALVKSGPTAKQVKFAKQSMVGSFPLAMSSNAQISGLLTGIAFYNLPLNYYDTYLQRLKQVSAKDVKSALQSVIYPQRMVSVIVGPEKKNGAR